ncbi:MAG: hypothetical protein EPO40_06160 [Myxococcaceae bacterium]|nr:MAG: hypothetical protein EPO40_06160 [Myxococcaceae bacterium]
MHDHQAAEAITCMTAREEVEAILRADWEVIGLVGPMLGIQWIPGFIRRISSECGGLALDSSPFALAEAAGFKVHSIYLPGRCGASTATTLFVQSQGDIYERNLSCLHELLHGLGLRRGLHLNETDWWLATAAYLLHIMDSPGGASLYPNWTLTAALRSPISG